MSRRGLLGALAALLVLPACGAGASAATATATTTATASTTASTVNPLAGTAFYVDPASLAAQQVSAWTAAGDTASAAQLQVVAEQPVATWFSGQQADPSAAAAELTAAAEAAGQVPVLVAYNLPERDCGSYSAGGAADEATYLAWLGALAAGIGERRAVVVLEPDAIAQALTGCAGSDEAQERCALLGRAVDVLKQQPGVLVYVDAGNSDWVTDEEALAAALASAGVDRADGFALNVSNYQTTEDSLAYGERLSDLLGGAHFVVDTSRNGAGATSREEDAQAWCNPPSARIGAPPTTDTGSARCDALLWVKEPGTSDGSCRAGEPAAGTWWPELALRLTSG